MSSRRDRSRWRSWVEWLVAGCVVAVLVGACNYKTTRVWDSGPPASGPTMTEGRGGWPAVAALCGLVALAAFVIAVKRRRSGDAPATLAASLLALVLAVAGVVAGLSWLEVVAEAGRERDYVLTIAAGAPVVTIAGTIGALLAGVWAISSR